MIVDGDDGDGSFIVIEFFQIVDFILFIFNKLFSIIVCRMLWKGYWDENYYLFGFFEKRLSKGRYCCI
jgi:hypothetical protein